MKERKSTWTTSWHELSYFIQVTIDETISFFYFCKQPTVISINCATRTICKIQKINRMFLQVTGNTKICRERKVSKSFHSCAGCPFKKWHFFKVVSFTSFVTFIFPSALLHQSLLYLFYTMKSTETKTWWLETIEMRKQ